MNRLLVTVAAVCSLVPAAPALADNGVPTWSPAAKVTEVNSAVADGCPIESPDGRELFIASTRDGTLGGNDIWIAKRKRVGDPWGTPQNLGAPVNGAANDFCPTPLRGNQLLFVSERPGDGTCNTGPGRGDIYFTWNPRLPRIQHLGCAADGSGPNFDGPEFSPSLVRNSHGTLLYFSSTGTDGNMNLYVSEQVRADRKFGPPAKVTELSTSADDRMPNVSPDGLRIVFVSNRTDLPGAQGDFDVYFSHRASVLDPWSAPVNLGPAVNSALAESRPTMSADGERLYFGRAGDIWMSLRSIG
jgi:hypothetical protein